MAHAESSINISRPIGEVFNFLLDGTNNTKWRDGVVSIELSSGKVGSIGARYKQVLKGPGGRSIPGDYEITKLVSNKELGFSVVAGPARPTGLYRLETVSDGTKLDFILDFQPKGLAKLMGPMIQKTMDSEVGQLPMLKKVLEEK